MQEENKESFIQDDKRAIYGSINGIFLYDFLWPYLCIFILQIILQDSYAYLVDTKYYTMSLILSIMTGIFTLLAGMFIAKPKLLIKAYNKISKSDVKIIFSCLGVMMAATFSYNLFLLMCGVDINGGNANQSAVLDLIKQNAFLSFISMVILAPILEEITYRYFLFGGIRKYNRKWAIVISGFIFMVAHSIASFTGEVDNIFREIILLPPYMFSGMVLAYAYDKTSNLAIPTSIHILNNLISFILSII